MKSITHELEELVADPKTDLEQLAFLIAHSRHFKILPSDDGLECLLDAVRSHGLAVKDKRTGWVMRDGFFLSCGYAVHDALVEKLGMKVETVERLGWCRISGLNVLSYQCLYRLSRQQAFQVRKRDILVDPDEQRLLPVWSEP